MADLEKVRQYWQGHPLYGYELGRPGTGEFFDGIERIKRDDIEKFSIKYWEFDNFKDKLVLDIGCGPGWITVNYASNDARVYAIDLTPRAVDLTRAFLNHRGLSAVVNEGNAENLRFEDGFFDLVVSSGALHHTPDTFKAMREACRVLKPAGRSKITLYYKGILHKKWPFKLTRAAMRLSGVKHPGADLSRNSKDADDFIRQYDGADNPIGIGKTRREWCAMLTEAGFVIKGYELHFFPLRFVPFGRSVPRFMHYLFDRYLGTMIYFDLAKSE